MRNDQYRFFFLQRTGSKDNINLDCYCQAAPQRVLPFSDTNVERLNSMLLNFSLYSAWAVALFEIVSPKGVLPIWFLQFGTYTQSHKRPAPFLNVGPNWKCRVFESPQTPKTLNCHILIALQNSEAKKPENTWCRRRSAHGIESVLLFGDPAEIRTPDTLLKRQVLCRLS